MLPDDGPSDDLPEPVDQRPAVGAEARRRTVTVGVAAAVLIGAAALATRTAPVDAAVGPMTSGGPTPSVAPTPEPASTGWPTPTVSPTRDGQGAQVREGTVRFLDCAALTPDRVHATPGARATFTLHNAGPDPIVVFAIDDHGQPQRRFDVPPGRTVSERTFVTYPWVVTTAVYRCVTVFYPPGDIEVG